MTEIDQRRRSFRFSLRALLVVVAAVAVFCAWLFPHLKWIRQRQEARAGIVSHNSIAFDAGLDFIMTRLDGSRVRTNDGGHTTTDGQSLDDLPKAPIGLRLLGEKTLHFIVLSDTRGEGEPPIDFQERDAKVPELQRLFPEAELIVYPPGSYLSRR